MKPVLRLRLHATQSQSCFPAASNALALLGGNVHGNADRAYNTLHFASKVVCQRASPLKPLTTKQAVCCPLWEHTAVCCQQPFHILFSPFVKFGVSGFMGFLKGKSNIMIYQKWGNMKYKYRNRSFWCRGYHVDTAGKNDKVIEAYIKIN